ncbi:MAG: proline racemase family protein [Betaproteobacteria bacterium]|nr:proline racemase family protein [Betaproteobacteria bacterium]
MSGSSTIPPSARIVDSHTGGEPTRLVVDGGPDLGGGLMQRRLDVMRAKHDAWRRALANEPRGHDVIVGGILTPPAEPGSLCGVIFFNNVGYLGMCGHGTIGLVATLAHLGRIQPGLHRIDTPVGTVRAELHADGGVTVANVASYRHRQGVSVEVPGHGRVTGDVAWGGNWFFLCADHGLALTQAAIPQLTDLATRVRQALAEAGITGAAGAVIDHIELLGPPAHSAHHGRNFVLCPGLAYDRSPCGTGTSAKLACLAADDALKPGEIWHQESVIGSVFSAHYERAPNGSSTVLPFIHGHAYVTLDAQVVFDPRDVLTWGIG